MTKHPRLLLSLTALGAMALGGTTIAQAASSSPSHPAEKVAAHDGDNIQSGDQTSPDPSSPTNAARHAAQRAVYGRHATRSAEPNGENPENSTETGPSDGPGGHADPPGNVDHQFSGQE
jgi:hypothetical protein